MSLHIDSTGSSATHAKELVSVVIPTHNRAELLKRAVTSVLAQTHHDLELIIVDDASVDHTRTVLAAIKDPRMHVIHRERNEGAAAARNVGIRAARGGLVAFLDDDDYFLEQKLERQVSALLGSDKQWCIASFLRKVGDEERFVGGDWYIHQLDYSCGVGEEGHDWSMIATPGWLVRRDTLLSVGAFDERIRSYDDWELGIRLMQASGFTIVDEPLWVQDVTDGGGLIRAERARARDLRIVMDKHGVLWKSNPKVIARHWYLIGRIESLYELAPAGRAELLRALRLDPLRMSTWFAIGMSMLGQRWNSRVISWARKIRSTFH